MFHDTYAVKQGDNLTKIGKQFGFSNPGPIVAYPENLHRFLNKSPNLIFPNEKFLIPWHPDLLVKYIATCKHLIDEVKKSTYRLIQEQLQNKNELYDFLLTIDAINFLSNTFVGIGSLACQGLKGVEMSSKQMIAWLIDSRASIASNITTLVIQSPEAPKKDFRFWIRHTLGPWNPSFWASVYVAIKEKDVDIYLYGADSIAYKNSLKIKNQAEADICKLRAKMGDAENQLDQPFYNKRI